MTKKNDQEMALVESIIQLEWRCKRDHSSPFGPKRRMRPKRLTTAGRKDRTACQLLYKLIILINLGLIIKLVFDYKTNRGRDYRMGAVGSVLHSTLGSSLVTLRISWKNESRGQYESHSSRVRANESSPSSDTFLYDT